VFNDWIASMQHESYLLVCLIKIRHLYQTG